ncbi:DUF1998 domain-containing protein [uncultured Sanguibacteroides sp.]|uniref:DUF1998 domain-containing protein n=1 Tax=uncultured Sanguibacteroides sp. TaxID=1635151 RepID=UPI0025F438FA|nr:DUF1998 domain-containing protein [uncultured Sanguibacteroides sp.]
MKEEVKHSRSKFISNYGGIGSLIDTVNSSIIIETFDNWQYPNYYDKELSKYIITDDRLLNRLKTRFPLLKQLVSIPTEIGGNVKPQANYFPKWFYCPHCKRFMHYSDWKRRWGTQGEDFNLQCFNPECKKEYLEQVRFVMTCPNGHIQDLPWNFWNNRKNRNVEDANVDKVDREEDDNLFTIFLNYTKCCEEQELYYEISNENTDLSGIRIKCKKCGKSESLKGIFGFQQKCGGKKYWLGSQEGTFIKETCDEKATVKIKSSNSVYYANTLSSLWIPEQQIMCISSDNCLLIDKWLEKGKAVKKIIEDMWLDYEVPRELSMQYIEQPKNTFIPEILYRQTEYEYFLMKKQPDDRKIRFRLINVENKLSGFKYLVKIDKLKKVTVQTSFTRNEPIDVDSVLVGDEEYIKSYNVKRQSLSKNSFNTYILPAIESYGEGILFVLDIKKLTDWEKKKEVIDRVNIIIEHGKRSDWKFHQIEAENLSPRKILIHTLAHLLMRELEYICGYPMSSMQERLYVSDTMYGFLISAYDGTNGYLGGLSKLCNDLVDMQEILDSALNRARNCSLDPICYESEGQGIAQLNLAACHSCTLLPELSCEHGNLFLDRQLVIDSEIGFFKCYLR